MDGWRLDRWNWQGITPFYSQSQQKAEAHSSQLYVFSNKLELERGSEGDKARGEKQSNASMPLSLYFSRFSLVNWILSGVVGRAPVQPRFFYTNQPLHLIHANHRRRSWCRHTLAPHLSQPRRPVAEKCGGSSHLDRSTSLDHARTKSLFSVRFKFLPRLLLDCAHRCKDCKIFGQLLFSHI